MIRSANAFKLVSPSQPDLQQLWGQSTSQTHLAFVNVPNKWGTFAVRVSVRVSVSVRVKGGGEVVPHAPIYT